MFKKTLFLVVAMFTVTSLCFAENYLLDGELQVEGTVKSTEAEGDPVNTELTNVALKYNYLEETTPVFISWIRNNDLLEIYKNGDNTPRISFDYESGMTIIPSSTSDYTTRYLRTGIEFDNDTSIYKIYPDFESYGQLVVDSHVLIDDFLRIGQVSSYPSLIQDLIDDGNQNSDGWELGFSVNRGGYFESMKIENKLVIGGTGYPDNSEFDDYALAIDGVVLTKEVQVKSDTSFNWPDYVFKDDYILPKLVDVEEFISQNNHLPNIPSKDEIEKDGFGLAEMQSKLLQKVEELTLYVIELQKKNEQLENKVEELSKKTE